MTPDDRRGNPCGCPAPDPQADDPPSASGLENFTPAQAIALQQSLRHQVISADQFGPLQRVAGVDVGFEQGGRVARAAVAVLSFPELELVETSLALQPVTFPYIPGLLSFREAPVVLAALSRLSAPPDLLVCDGHGFAHPRRFGLACHLGLLAALPSIGAAKSRLLGEYVPPPDERGAWQPLLDAGEVIGAVLRTRPGTKPIFISIGHRLCLETALDLILRCTTRYRIPEPTRQAHHLASQN
jgi:deoxyribonuclease V